MLFLERRGHFLTVRCRYEWDQPAAQHARSRSPTGDVWILYALSLLVLALYSIVVGGLLPDQPLLGLAASCSIVVLDFTTLMFARLDAAWSTANASGGQLTQQEQQQRAQSQTQLTLPASPTAASASPSTAASVTTAPAAAPGAAPSAAADSALWKPPARLSPGFLILVCALNRVVLVAFDQWWFVGGCRRLHVTGCSSPFCCCAAGDSAVYLVFGTILADHIVRHRLNLFETGATSDRVSHRVSIAKLLRSAVAQTAEADVSAAGQKQHQDQDEKQPQQAQSASQVDPNSGELEYLLSRLAQWSLNPEFVLGLLKFFFLLLLIIVRFIKPNGVPLQSVPLAARSHAQYLFGLAALFWVICALLALFSRGLLVRAKWKLTRQVAISAAVAETAIVLSGLFIFLLTGLSA